MGHPLRKAKKLGLKPRGVLILAPTISGPHITTSSSFLRMLGSRCPQNLHSGAKEVPPLTEQPACVSTRLTPTRL